MYLLHFITLYLYSKYATLLVRHPTAQKSNRNTKAQFPVGKSSSFEFGAIHGIVSMSFNT